MVMTNVRDIIPCLVGLPDGRHTVATKQGTVVLGNHIIRLLDVLDERVGIGTCFNHRKSTEG